MKTPWTDIVWGEIQTNWQGKRISVRTLRPFWESHGKVSKDCTHALSYLQNKKKLLVKTDSEQKSGGGHEIKIYMIANQKEAASSKKDTRHYQQIIRDRENLMRECADMLDCWLNKITRDRING